MVLAAVVCFVKYQQAYLAQLQYEQLLQFEY
jgi:hypothetical protein